MTELELVTAGRRIETEVHIDKSKSAVTQVPSGYNWSAAEVEGCDYWRLNVGFGCS